VIKRIATDFSKSRLLTEILLCRHRERLKKGINDLIELLSHPLTLMSNQSLCHRFSELASTDFRSFFYETRQNLNHFFKFKPLCQTYTEKLRRSKEWVLTAHSTSGNYGTLAALSKLVKLSLAEMTLVKLSLVELTLVKLFLVELTACT
jgi:hypothetical protein